MSRSIEDLVRAAQHEQAERAPDPQRVLAALPERRVRAVRRRRLVLTLAAAAVVAVAAVPAIVLRAGPAPQPPSFPPSPSASTVERPPVPLEYTPGWLPPGYAEYGRAARSAAGLTRIWAPAPPKSPLLLDDAPGRLTMIVTRTEDAEVTVDDGDEPVKINGADGGYRTQGPPAVYWRRGAMTIDLRADEPGLSKATLLRIARSVTIGPNGTGQPFEVRPPTGLAVAARFVTGGPLGEWLAVTELGEPEPGGDVAASGISVSIGTVTPAPAGGSTLRVAGRPARYLYSEVPEPGHYLVVDLGGGLQQTVYSMELDQPAMVALAEGTSAPNPAAVDWIGS